MNQTQAAVGQKRKEAAAQPQAGLTRSGVPFIVYDGLIFHGMPVKGAFPPKGLSDRKAEELQQAFAQILTDISFRYEFKRGVVPHKHCDILPGDAIMEAGAFLGYYSMYFARRVGPLGKVFSVEFHPGAYRILKRNFLANFPETATAIHKGVFNTTGTQKAFLFRNQANSFREDVILDVCKASPGDYQEVDVPVDTLANILAQCGFPRLKLLTIQVNGSELEALEGLDGTEHLVENIFVAAPYGKDGRENNVAPAMAMLEKYNFTIQIENRTGIYAKSAR
ncbi:hypothetical protein DVDV_1414 [Desulfovibrio sp. DV]|uniref:FkbM family methyltransferase n=1 Tax=Desulfovibrio sp. DV TaxID=1844708 RepID=UPI00094BACFB|nr:FkbM family methyltransferase [Desulfovibrio sp. DV]OLN28849.1 hypothetical protein DVDV_1414 [Desulfovibrio sp. DV]